MACRAPAPVAISEGARRLRIVRGSGATRTPLKAIAADLGISIEMVRRLLDGLCAPGLALSVRIEALYGIAPREWLEAAKAIQSGIEISGLPDTGETVTVGA